MSNGTDSRNRRVVNYDTYFLTCMHIKMSKSHQLAQILPINVKLNNNILTSIYR